MEDAFQFASPSRRLPNATSIAALFTPAMIQTSGSGNNGGILRSVGNTAVLGREAHGLDR